MEMMFQKVNIYPIQTNLQVFNNFKIPDIDIAVQQEDKLELNTNKTCSFTFNNFKNLKAQMRNIYNEKLLRELNLRHPPHLILSNPLMSIFQKSKHQAAVYNPYFNTIFVNSFYLKQISSENFCKIYIIKNGKKQLFINKLTLMPLFDKRNEITKKSEEIKKKLKADELIIIPITDREKEKVIIGILTHELRHAYQFEAIKRTEGLGYSELNNAMAQRMPPVLNVLSWIEGGFILAISWIWNNFEGKDIKEDSPKGQRAKEFLEDIKHYSNNVRSKKYKESEVEKDARKFAHEYIINHYEDWQ